MPLGDVEKLTRKVYVRAVKRLDARCLASESFCQTR